MNKINTLKLKSAFFNGVAAAFSVSYLSLTLLDYRDEVFAVQLGIAFVISCFYAWFFSSWYQYAPNKKWRIAPYLATTVISFPTAVTTGLLYMILISFGSKNLPLSEFLLFGFMGGIISAIHAIPASIVLGIFVGLILYPATESRQDSK